MYNISQALSTGKMQQIDWKSIENAGMATLEFKQNVIDTALAMGKLVGVGNDAGHIYEDADHAVKYFASSLGSIEDITEDDLFDAKSFREQLKTGWFDNEVMSEVFQRYAEFTDKLYEATQSTELEATDVLEVLDKYRTYMDKGKEAEFDWAKYAGKNKESIEALQKAIQGLIDTKWEYSEQGFRMGQEAKTWEDTIEATKDAVSSKWMRTFQWVIGDYLEAKDFWTEVTARLYDVFAAGGDVRNDILEAWYIAGGRDAWFNLDEESGPIGAFWNLLDAIESVTNPIKEALYEVFGWDEAETFGEHLAELSIQFRDFTATMGLTEEAQEGLKNIFKLVFTGGKNVLKVAGGVLAIVGKVSLAIGNFADSILSIFSGKQDLSFVDAFSMFLGDLSAAVPSFDKVTQKLSGIYSTILDIPSSLQRIRGFLKDPEHYAGVLTDFDFTLLRIREKLIKVGETIRGIPESLRKVRDFLKDPEHYMGVLTDGEKALADFVGRFRFLSPVLSVVANILDIIVSVASVGITTVSGLVDSILSKMPNLETVQMTVTGWYQSIQNLLGGKLPSIDEIAKKIDEFRTKISQFFGGNLPNFESFRQKLSDMWTIIRDFFTGKQTDFSQVQSVVDRIVAFASMVIRTAYEVVKERVSQIKFSDILNALKTALKLSLLAEIANIAGNVRKIAKEFSSIPEAITGTFSSISDTFDQFKESIKVNTVIKFALAVAILAGAMYLLSKVPTEQLIVVTAALGGMLFLLSKLSKGNLFNFTKIIDNTRDMSKKLSNNTINVIPKLAANILAIAIAMGVLVHAVNSFKKNEVGLWDIGKVVLMLGAVVAIMYVFVKKMQGLNTKDIGKSFGILITMFAIIGRVTKMAKTAKDVPWYQLVIMFLGMTLLMQAMSSILERATRFKKFKDNSILQVAAVILAIGVVIGMMTKTVKKLGKMNWTQMLQGIAGLGLLMLELGGLMAWMSRLNSSGVGSMIQIAGGMALMAVSIRLLTKPLVAFGKLDWGQMLQGVAGIGLIMVMLGGLAAWMSRMEPGKILLIAGAMAIMAVAISLLSPVLSVLGTIIGTVIAVIPWDKITGGVGNFTERIIRLLALGGVLLLFGVGMKMLGTGMLRFGAGAIMATGSLLIISLAILAVAAAIHLLSDSLPQFFQAIIDTFDIIKENGEKFAQIVGVILGAIALAIIARKLDLANAVVQLGGAVLTALQGMSPTMLATIGGIVVALLGYLFNLLEPLANVIMRAIITLLNAIGNALRDNEDSLIAAVMNVAEAVLEAVLKALLWISNIIPRAFVRLVVEPIQEKLAKMFESMPGLSKLGFIKDFVQWDAEDWVQNDYKAASDKMSSFIQEMMIPPETESTIEGNARALGELQMTAFGEGAEASKGEALKSFYELHEDLAGEKTQASWRDSFKGLGEYMPEGVASGIFGNSGVATGAVDWLGQQLMSHFQSQIDAHSPSRAFASLAEYIPAGVANGVDKNSDEAIDSIVVLSDSLILAMERSMARVGTIADDNFDIQPSIVPVVDTSDLSYTAASINSMFNRATVGLRNNVNDIASNVNYSLDNSGTLTEMRLLSQKVDNLGTAITNMQIVMDTGALVGATSARMDRSFGVMATRRGRGN